MEMVVLLTLGFMVGFTLGLPIAFKAYDMGYKQAFDDFIKGRK